MGVLVGFVFVFRDWYSEICLLVVVNVKVLIVDVMDCVVEVFICLVNKFLLVGIISEVLEWVLVNVIVIDVEGVIVILGFNDSYMYIVCGGMMYVFEFCWDNVYLVEDGLEWLCV